MTSLVKKKMNNWLAFKMLIRLILWNGQLLNACDIQLMMGKDFGDINETLKTQGPSKHTFTMSLTG